MAVDIDLDSPFKPKLIMVLLAVVFVLGGFVFLVTSGEERRKASFNAMPAYKEDPRTNPHTCFALWENQVVTVDCERIPKNLLSSW